MMLYYSRYPCRIKKETGVHCDLFNETLYTKRDFYPSKALFLYKKVSVLQMISHKNIYLCCYAYIFDKKILRIIYFMAILGMRYFY